MRNRFLIAAILVLGISPFGATPAHARPRGEQPHKLTDGAWDDPAQVLNAAAFPKADWAIALKRGDKQQAIADYVKLLRTGPARSRLDHYRASNKPASIEQADDIVNLRFSDWNGGHYQFKDKIDWKYDAVYAATGVHSEWQWQLGRHNQWITLAKAYEQTHDAKYARAWEKELRSWLAAALPRPRTNHYSHPNLWRTIDTGCRTGIRWPYAFEIFRTSKDVSDQALWHFVCGMREQGLFLLQFHGTHNWLIIESNGLGHVGMMFPELIGADKMAKAALKRAQACIEEQFYPDGTHYELAPAYADGVCIKLLYSLASLAQYHRLPVDPTFMGRLSKAAMAICRIANRQARVPALHDSGSISVKHLFEFARKLTPGQYKSPPWLKTTGERLPWGGYAVFRGRGADRYALLDAGPWGRSTHRHNDCLQFINAFEGRWFCFDPGKPKYQRVPMTRFLRSSAAHNVVQMDGKWRREARPVLVEKQPMPMAFAEKQGVTAAAALRHFSQMPVGKRPNRSAKPRPIAFAHERIVLDIPKLGWLLLDRMTPVDAKTHTWQWMWHMPVDRVELRTASGGQTSGGSGGASGVAIYDRGPRMSIAAACTAVLEAKVVQGRTKPTYQGWTLGRVGGGHPGGRQPVPTLTFTSVRTSGPVVTATLMRPCSAGQTLAAAPLQLNVARDRVTVSVGGPTPVRVTYRGSEAVDAISCRVDGKTIGLALQPHAR